MKNLTPLTRKISYWDGIVKSKNKATRAELQKIRCDVLNRFKLYTNHTKSNTLEAITASPFVSPNIAYLESPWDFE